MSDFYTKKEIDNSTVEFTITIPQERFRKEYQKLLSDELTNTDIKGFRKGKVPSDIVEPKVGGTLKIQAFEKLIPEVITEAIEKENIEPIAPPEYKDFPNLEEDKDLEFTIKLTVMPEFKLGDLKKIKLQKEEAKIEKEEIDKALENIRDNQETKEKEINEKWAKEIIKLLKLENDVKDLKDLRKHLEDALTKQKEHMLKHKLEDQALQEAIKISNIEIPEAAIKFEAEERERAFITDMQNKGINIEDFLKANNITIEKMRELWLKDAKQALETDSFLRMYIKDRGIEINDEDLKKKIEEIKKGAPEGTDESVFENDQWKEYIRRVEQKEKAFQSFIQEVIGDTKEQEKNKKDKEEKTEKSKKK
jgi:trigger factor